MKTHKYYLPSVLLGSAACLGLRLAVLRNGFEPETGLPIHASPLFLLLPALLVALALLFFFLLRTLPPEPAESGDSFASFFPATSKPVTALFVSGIFLLAISGVAEIFSGITVSPSLFDIASGALSLLAAACLLPVLRAVAQHAETRSAEGKLLPIFVGCLVLRFIEVYRQEAISPILASYYVEILALTFLILSFYRLSSFAYGLGNSRRFLFYTGLAIPLCFASVAGTATLGALLFYLAVTVLLLSFLLLRLGALAKA